MGNSGYARIVLNWSFFDRSADYTVQAAAQQIVAAEKRAELLEGWLMLTDSPLAMPKLFQLMTARLLVWLICI